ncbi:uncharacterized protein L969DRAFT_90192 [Mixia osmundae IAM 14324]|uniref:Aquaporin n=1 Tax=Mixia osmundae (strain CBS 9802 / IAM 14324 / JCM 22182 / KY 12970) TaxID=764103 RepID=G7DSW4_MIXOS|nr:uncharacterized protein L969DRAFT_90192 [Mixia osmundae IAM 14324]KEI37130.1 hypothetical protein L969DRAFT_90192 [Mixia osmundae IAM 14324]GAA93674.1 hypothetical protein E5Q_00319 [Mixia osmundae IAM 14324]
MTGRPDLPRNLSAGNAESLGTASGLSPSSADPRAHLSRLEHVQTAEPGHHVGGRTALASIADANSAPVTRAHSPTPHTQHEDITASDYALAPLAADVQVSSGLLEPLQPTQVNVGGVTAPLTHQHQHQHHHRPGYPRQHTNEHPAFSLSGNRFEDPLVAAAYGYGAYGQRPFESAQEALRRRRVQGLGRPLPSYAEMQVLKAQRDAMRHRKANSKGPSRQNSWRAPDALPAPKSASLGPAIGQTWSHQIPTSSHRSADNFVVLSPDQFQALTQGTSGQSSEKSEQSKAITAIENSSDPYADSKEKRPQSFTSSSSSSNSDDEEDFPNPWSRIRHKAREPFAEFLGTIILITFGNGVNCQVTLSSSTAVSTSPKGDYLSISFGWAMAVVFGIYASGGISGGHINPAVTISLAVFRGFPWRKVPIYIFAQILGAMCGALMVYATYHEAITIYEGGPNIRTHTGPTATAALFSTYPLTYVGAPVAFFNEIYGTAILMIIVLAVSDKANATPTEGMNPLIIGLLVLAIGACLGSQTAYCINPARDFGPRLATWIVGYGKGVWTFYSWYWIWTPIVATICGALLGSLAYDMLIYTGLDSPVNQRWGTRWTRKEPNADHENQTQVNAPAGEIQEKRPNQQV